MTSLLTSSSIKGGAAMPHPLCIRAIAIVALLCNILVLAAQSPNWQPPDANLYPFSANAIIQIEIDGIGSNTTSDTVAVFSGGELRGLGVPVDLGNGSVVHFITIYGATASELMAIEVYSAAFDQVITALGTLTFVSQGVYGTLSDPYLAACYLNTSPPISLLPIPAISTIDGVPSMTIDLSQYLVQTVAHPVVWSVTPNPVLQVTLTGSLLTVSNANGFLGATVLGIDVVEDIPGGSSTSGGVFVGITQGIAGPTYEADIMQGQVLGQPFDTIDLTKYETTYSGACLVYDWVPVLVSSQTPVAAPSWTIGPSGSTTMSMVVEAQYTPNYSYGNPQDELAVFANGILRGVASPVAYQGKTLYFLTIYGDAAESTPLEISFYSHLQQEVHDTITTYTYAPNAIIGSLSQPVVVDFARLLPAITSDGEVSVDIIDPTWVGTEEYLVTASDCNYSQISTTTTVSLCITSDPSSLTTYYRDADGDGVGSSGCLTQACTGSYSGWVLTGGDCDDTNDQSTILSYAIQAIESSMVLNDGHVCPNESVTLSLSGGHDVLWETGSIDTFLIVQATANDTINVTISSVSGCSVDASYIIRVEGDLIYDTGDYGPGTLRSVLECGSPGMIATFDPASVDTCRLLSTLLISKNVTLDGSGHSDNPVLHFNVGSDAAIDIPSNVVLRMTDIDLVNPIADFKISGAGEVKFKGEGRID